MLKLAPLTLLVLLACLVPGWAQVAPPLGWIKVQGKGVKIGSKKEQPFRKRFYLLRGGLEANKALVERLRAVEPASRDCFYCRSKASPEFIDWLREKNCETPYCREITAEDVKKVPEFLAAYRKGLTQFRRPELARKWITTNLPAGLREGIYRQKKTLLAGLLGDATPIQSVMTDSNNADANFIDIPMGEKRAEKFFVSNLLPVEMDGKGYIWVCEIEITPGKLASLPLHTKKCETIIRPLPVCTAGSCDK
jgi:hypothetical protein